VGRLGERNSHQHVGISLKLFKLLIYIIVLSKSIKVCKMVCQDVNYSYKLIYYLPSSLFTSLPLSLLSSFYYICMKRQLEKLVQCYFFWTGEILYTFLVLFCTIYNFTIYYKLVLLRGVSQ